VSAALGGVAPHGARSEHAAAPDYVLVGHVTRDVVPGGFVPGGTITYAGLTALALGRQVAAVTSVGPDFLPDSILPGVPVAVAPADATTTFENVYHGGHRQQWLRARAASLPVSLVPAAWRSAPIVHLAPLVEEFGAEMAAAFAGSRLLGLTPQGWLRAWDDDGFVHRRAWPEPEAVLRACDAVVLSEEDVEGDWALCAQYAALAHLLVVTQGAAGCTVFERGRPWSVPAYPAVEVDATGAGDVFAAAFFISFLDRGDPVAAARYANCVASFAVEAIGPHGVPTPAAVAERLTGYEPLVIAR
jgi:1D-myo-inositol 3-kinase